MKKFLKFMAVLLVTACLVSGCLYLFKVSLYPVQGPLIESGLARKFSGSFTWTGSGHGKIKFILDDEICKGEYTTYAFIEGKTSTLFTNEQYTAFYGTAHYTYGMQYGQAIGYGDKGTIIEAEYFVNTSLTHGYGLAKDNHGNIYKVMF